MSEKNQSLSVTIAGRKIGPGRPPYVIAEMSANHNGAIEDAFAIIEMAKRCGADAVKMQTYRPDTITIDSDGPEFRIRGGLWDGRTLYDLYEEAHTPWEWHEPLFAKAREVGITLFSSPFDSTAVDLLESLGAPAYKIASFEAVDLPLIANVARTGKPVIISTGMASAEEIAEAIDCARSNGCHDLLILRCVSGYPAPARDYNLAMIPDMERRFGVLVGLSDHTIDNVTAIASVALGACIIEKHVTLDRTRGGPDDSFSLEEPELTQLCRDARIAWEALGTVDYALKASEQASVLHRRSLYVVKEIKAGEAFTNENVRSIRPGNGLPPKRLDDVLKARSTRDLERGTALEESHLDSQADK
jgi:N-acetylneuraminate synthase